VKTTSYLKTLKKYVVVEVLQNKLTVVLPDKQTFISLLNQEDV
jgi:hypothetical protein